MLFKEMTEIRVSREAEAVGDLLDGKLRIVEHLLSRV